MSKKIAVIGSGISGLVSAYLLSKDHEVSLFEANDYLGGHTHTVDVNIDDISYAIDTGFIVFNKKTYPNFCKLINSHHIPIQASEMSFSYRSNSHSFEYNGHNLNTLFSDRRNIFNPRFYKFIKEILKFNKQAKIFLLNPENHQLSIADFIKINAYSDFFVEKYMIPMMAAIWSKRPMDILKNSAYFILQFYNNHGLLDAYNRPPWYVIKGGSRNYIYYFTKNFESRIYLKTKIEKIRREENQVILYAENCQHVFDKVLIATHSDQALKILDQPTALEIAILSAIPYIENEVILHTDFRVMPRNKRAWASWNYYDRGSELPTLTYYMNRLQSLESPHHFFVSMNLGNQIDENKIIKKFSYHHPCFSQLSIQAQRDHQLINGKNHTYFAGAYWGYGFHEDGVKSAMHACEPFGVSL